MMNYQVGEKVIHRKYGLGEIIRIDDKLIHERQLPCYVVRTRDLTIWVTDDDPGKSSIRPPTPVEEFEKLFSILRSPGEPLPLDRFARKNLIFARVKDGDLPSICSVIRDLTLYRREKKFNEDDKSTLERAQNFLLAEWTYSLGVTHTQASKTLMELLGIV